MANRQGKPSIERTVQDMVGWSFDNEFKVITIAQVEYDGANVVRKQSDNVATRIDDTTTANVSYVGKAPVGSATSSAVWQIKRIDTSSGAITTWADGDAQFNNIWDNRSSLSYS